MSIFIFDFLRTCGGFTDWLSKHMIPCPSKFFFHMDCPGCGLQRSVLALLEGDLEKSLQLYPATIPILFLVIFGLLHVKFDYKNGAAIIKWVQIFCGVVILVSYIYKVVTYKIFN
jgi:hypothetical protein